MQAPKTVPINNIVEGKQHIRRLVFVFTKYKLDTSSMAHIYRMTNNDDIPVVNDTTRLLQHSAILYQPDQQEAVLQYPPFIKALQLFREHLDWLRSSSLHHFEWPILILWQSCLASCKLLERAFGTCIHLHFIRWYFVYDRQTYAYYLPVFYQQMIRLPKLALTASQSILSHICHGNLI